MRLMAGHIEIAQPEREVDGVDVFEGRSEKWKVKGEVGCGEEASRPDGA
jgi:hypothetical protein